MTSHESFAWYMGSVYVWIAEVELEKSLVEKAWVDA
jgi:hypothetical protein